MAILVPKWLDFSWQVRLQMFLKFCTVKIANCMGSPNEQHRNFYLLTSALVKCSF
jgi:hypothetical protein